MSILCGNPSPSLLKNSTVRDEIRLPQWIDPWNQPWRHA
jgi:hypothetical protein